MGHQINYSKFINSDIFNVLGGTFPPQLQNDPLPTIRQKRLFRKYINGVNMRSQCQQHPSHTLPDVDLGVSVSSAAFINKTYSANNSNSNE